MLNWIALNIATVVSTAIPGTVRGVFVGVRYYPSSMARRVARSDILAFRMHAQGLDSAPGSVAAPDVPILDTGVQDTGPDGTGWALVNRGAHVGEVADPDLLALAWTLRVD